jgi:hypothetical protein
MEEFPEGLLNNYTVRLFINLVPYLKALKITKPSVLAFNRVVNTLSQRASRNSSVINLPLTKARKKKWLVHG